MSTLDSRRHDLTEDEVLTLAETAAYLKLAERTIHRMIKRNAIPCVRVGGQWRFLRSVLDDWLLSGMQVLPRNELAPLLDGAEGVVRLAPTVDAEHIVDRIKPGSTRSILTQLVQPLVELGLVRNPDGYVDLLLARERLSSTALGHGVAVPHVRRPSENPVGAPAVLLGICRSGAEYGALDAQPVHFFFLLGTTSEVVHLRLLKRITLLFRDHALGGRLLECETADALLDELRKTEQRLFPGG